MICIVFSLPCHDLHCLLFALSYKSISLEPILHQSICKLSRTTVYKLNSSEYSAKKAGEAAMISAKRLVQMAKKWQIMAVLARKRLTATPGKEAGDSCGVSTSVAVKGHCVVYSSDWKRFEIPLAYLGTVVFSELLSMSQEDFGFPGDDGRITLPCEAAVMEYVMCLLRRDASEEVVRAFLSSMVRPCHHSVSGMAPSMGLMCQSAMCV